MSKIPVRGTDPLLEALRPLLEARGVALDAVAGFQVGSMAGSGQLKVTVWTAARDNAGQVWHNVHRVEWQEPTAWR